jgi:hypothetical protein
VTSSAFFVAGKPALASRIAADRPVFRRGTAVASEAGMSPVGHALHQQFERVCRSELQRLRRKTAALTEEDRAQVDALALEVAQRLAVHLDAALDAPGGAGITPVVMRLFAVAPPGSEL